MVDLRLVGYWGFILCLWLLPTHHQALANQNIESTRTIDSSESANELLNWGIGLYEEQSYELAKDLWFKSASLYAQQNDILGEALALNNIALTHQQLGEWNLAGKAIARSFSLLQSRNLVKLPGYWEILAKVNNTQGNYQLQIGEAELALKSWQDASRYYLRANNQSGNILAQINQAKVLQSLGFTVKAVDILGSLERRLENEPNSRLKARGLKHLGVSLRKLGDLDKSALVLKQSVSLGDKQSNSSSLLELGNTQRKQGDRAWEIGKRRQAQEYFSQALSSYDKAATFDDSMTAKLNQFSLLVDLGKDRQAEEFASGFKFPTQLQPNRSQVYALLNYSHSLTCLRLSVEDIPICQAKVALDKTLNPTRDTTKTNTANETVEQSESAMSLTNSAIALARQIQDPLAEAQAMSQLAQIYEIQGNDRQAQNLNQQALLLLEGKFAPDIAYRLSWQLGRIYRQQGNIDAATTSYSQAIASLEKVRANLLLIDPQVQFSFRDRIEPVYREYTDLLLTVRDNSSPSENNLKQAIKTIDALQLAELENFLGCNLSQSVALNETSIDSTAMQIYPIILKDRLVTIVEIPGKPLIFKETRVSRSQVLQTVDALQNNLTQSAKTPEVLASGRQIYRWAIEPLEPVLAKNPSIKTLVFVPDSVLRNIPFNVLYDGEEYLLEKDYAVAVSPRLKLFAPAPSSSPLKVLTGGVDIPQTIEGFSFGEIAQVKQELNQIAALVNTNDPLLNEAFTPATIEQELQGGNFSAIHWKTHGIFSSDPSATFLVAYQNSIKANELQSLVRAASQSGQKPLELLVLSACETAQGDNRAILGLAGLTVRTGARTALSTLWQADDRATTLLMTEFYRQLSLGNTKAEALRQAQLSLFKEEGYFAPYHWGTYILVGNWL